MRLTRPKTPTVKIQIQEYLGSQGYIKNKSVVITVYNTTQKEVEEIVRTALKNAAEEIETSNRDFTM